MRSFNENKVQTKLGVHWHQEKVSQWLEERGWGHFISTFEKYEICHERFLHVTLAELVQYLPRTMTTYYERRRLLKEIRSLLPSTQPTPTTPTNISINTNLHPYQPRLGESITTTTTTTGEDERRGVLVVARRGGGDEHDLVYKSPFSSHLSLHLNDTMLIMDTYSADSSPSSSSSIDLTRKSPTRLTYSPKAAFSKLKATFQRSHQQYCLYAHTQQSAPTLYHTSRQYNDDDDDEEEDEDMNRPPAIPARVSSTPDKVSKFWASYASWHSPTNKHTPSSPNQQKSTAQRIQITTDRETWYSLNVTNMRDPVAIKHHILSRLKITGDIHHHYFYHENSGYASGPMDPQELMYICSIADHNANERILVRPITQLYSNSQLALSTPELGKSPSGTPQKYRQKSSPPLPPYKPLHRQIIKKPSCERSVGVQLSDPPSMDAHSSLWAVPPCSQPLPLATSKDAHTPSPSSSSNYLHQPRTPSYHQTDKSKTHFWGERPPAEMVVQHMEDYFDSQDLDKEVVLPTTDTKSIRLVAREASRKYTHLTRQKGISRRKSTKLWGQRVIELKKTSRAAHVIARLPSVSEHISLSHHATPTDTTVQWIRGKMIGKGSFGRVYLAFNVDTGEVIAVKQVEVPKTDQMHPQQYDVVEALYQEIMMLRNLDHEHIVQYLGYGYDEAEGVINIFLDYVSGGSVASRLALQGAFDEPLTRYFTRQICLGLEYLHSRHILHRDIKAANILVEADGICKISDFGLSKKNDYEEVYDQNSRMSLRGSIYWMAPEVVKNEPYSAKVDIWSLGCTVIEMLTGQRPWIAFNQIAALYNLGKLNSPTIPNHISEDAKNFLQQCFVIDPLQRPTAAELLRHPFLKDDPCFQFKDYIDKGKI
ncbi:MAP kinase kinase kinase mkh1 [Choanephora cucurbitarum]|uniref:MAP kinase kinase kinase mkh1 n=1 Tax=Choanephora cucurbitarum TaxID=101091 RepID=A0A1C7NEU2_9FUNG|nr:MAP kinase kinase kinase mkh1 [Choanephora cucurbitarum]